VREKVVHLSRETGWLLRGTVEDGWRTAWLGEIKWKRLDWDCGIRLISKIGIAGPKRKSRHRGIADREI
jgi:hypothetical protein